MQSLVCVAFRRPLMLLPVSSWEVLLCPARCVWRVPSLTCGWCLPLRVAGALPDALPVACGGCLP